MKWMWRWVVLGTLIGVVSGLGASELNLYARYDDTIRRDPEESHRLCGVANHSGKLNEVPIAPGPFLKKGR